MSRPPLSTGEERAVALAVSPDGAQFATVDGLGALRLWDLGSGREIGPPLQVTGETIRLFYVDDGTRLVSSSDGHLTVWNLNPESWRKTACELAGRDMTRDEWDTYLPDEPYRATCTGG